MVKKAETSWQEPMGEANLELVSAMMDGELDHEQSIASLARMKSNPACHEHWATYHLIGDTLRQLPNLSNSFNQRFSQRLTQEPTILAPQRSALTKRPLVMFSAAASVAVITMAIWQSGELTGEPAAPAQMARSNGTQLATANDQQTRRRVNEYLLAHQEYSPSSAMQGVAPYVRTVYETVGDGGR